VIRPTVFSQWFWVKLFSRIGSCGFYVVFVSRVTGVRPTITRHCSYEQQTD